MSAPRPADPLAPVRVRGGIDARFSHDGTRTVIASAAERGGYRLARPATFARHLEALHINTGGGVAGGDLIETRYALTRGTDVVHTTSSAERIYRSLGAPSRLDVRLSLEPGSRLDWLPQQTIVYLGARLERRIDVDMAGDSRLLIVELLTFGRPASEEARLPAVIDDQWRIRRDGRLVLAEALRLAGDLSDMLARPAVGGGARAAALVVLVAPDAADHVEELRRALEGDSCESGVSAWDGLVAVRALAALPGRLVAQLSRTIPILTGRPMPRVWTI